MTRPAGRTRRDADGNASVLPSSAAIDPRQSRSAQVYDLLRDAIVSLWLKPGECISEKAIAEQLGISRTPVREALMRLSDEGLVEIFPQSGTFVSPIKLQDVLEGQVVREALELAVVRRASTRCDEAFSVRFEGLLRRQRECARWNDYDGFHALDEEFHRTISECSGTPRVWRIIMNAKAQLDRVRRLGMRAPGQLQQIIRQHEAIFLGLKSGDKSKAVEALKVHLEAVFDSINALVEGHATYFTSDSSASPVNVEPLVNPVDYTE
jgi:DNA-binding GntR family transcriptional regulator